MYHETPNYKGLARELLQKKMKSSVGLVDGHTTLLWRAQKLSKSSIK
jgi:hypothetical protein